MRFGERPSVFKVPKMDLFRKSVAVFLAREHTARLRRGEERSGSGRKSGYTLQAAVQSEAENAKKK